MASSLPPELMQFLLEQQKAEGRPAVGKPHQFPTQPSMSNVPRSIPKGVFNPATQNTLKAMGKGVARGALRAAGPVGFGVAMAPTAWDIGSKIGDAYYNETMADEYKRFAAEDAAKQPVDVGPVPSTMDRQQQLPKSYLPEELMDMVAEGDGEDAMPQEAGMIPVTDERQEQVPPEMLVEAQLLPQQAPPRVEEFPESRGTLAALSKGSSNRPAPYEEKPKSFLRKTGDFFRSGSRNPELDKSNAALDNYERQNRLTDRDKLGADTASKDVFSARAANFGGEMAKYAGQGVAPEDKFMADLYGDTDQQERRDASQSSRDLTQHGYRLDEISAMAAGKTGGDPQEKFIMDFFEKYPDADPTLAAKLGLQIDPEFISSVRKGREGSQVDKVAQTMMLLEMLRGGRSKPDSTPASEKAKEPAKKKVPELKDTSMLNSSK